ncbi:hypothetical protein AJ80_09942 [Polytolypa hystricis UAMH7299]|uniref:Uncharacterized protein n=1 Tax=Polytolypa hystricis (strain UAMH7299) TaxID=1447883 RepID=A0A2B7WFU3_POLH7|nr:hypothetical protein AJ80_09942 [Polytolypa hystricis UAMH7299]
MSGNTDKAKEARDTLSSIYSFYAANQETLEHVPSFLSNTSAEIKIGVQIPSAQQTEGLKKHLKELIATQELLNNVSESDLRAMTKAANASTIKRKENQTK